MLYSPVLGNEPMYSGINGQELQADIYFGVVYYQRLRHMVKDKFQVRSTGTNEYLQINCIEY